MKVNTVSAGNNVSQTRASSLNDHANDCLLVRENEQLGLQVSCLECWVQHGHMMREDMRRRHKRYTLLPEIRSAIENCTLTETDRPVGEEDEGEGEMPTLKPLTPRAVPSDLLFQLWNPCLGCARQLTSAQNPNNF